MSVLPSAPFFLLCSGQVRHDVFLFLVHVWCACVCVCVVCARVCAQGGSRAPDKAPATTTKFVPTTYMFCRGQWTNPVRACVRACACVILVM
jgi:hypothetical protein